MSKGNEKSGTTTNYDWQFSVLDQLVRIKNALVSGTITVIGTFTASSTQRTTSRTSETASGSVASGAKWISFETSDDFEGTIEGVTAQTSRFYSYPTLQNNDYYNAVAYTITAGSLIIGKAV